MPKHSVGARKPMEVPMAVNVRWSLDFLSNALAEGRFPSLETFADFISENLVLIAYQCICGPCVLRTACGHPETISSDNGTEPVRQY